METYTRDQVNQLIRQAKGEDSLRSLAVKWQVSPAYVSDVLLCKREPGPKILSPLGLRRNRSVTITYVRKRKGKK